MPKVRSNAQSAYEAKRKMRESERRDDNLFPDDSTRTRKEKYGSRTREAEDRERDRDDDRRRDREDDRERTSGRRERISDERDPERSRRGREEADRADRRARQEDRNDSRSDRERGRDSKQLAEIRYQLNKMYNFIKDFEKDMSNKERDAWDVICYEADAEEFALSGGRRPSRDRRDDDDDRRDSRRRRDDDSRSRRDEDSRNDRPRRRDREDEYDRDRRRGNSRRGDDEDMRYRRGGKYRGEDRYESNGLCKGDVKKLINVIKDERLKFKGRLDDDLFYITDEINMGNYTRKYEDAFLNLLEELDSIKLYEKENRYDIDDLVDIYMPRDSRGRSTDRRGYRDDDRDYDDRRRSSGGRRRDDDDDYDRDRRSGSGRVRARSRRDDDEDDYYDRRDDRRSGGRRRVASSRREDDYDDRDRRDDRRRPSNDNRRRDDNRYSGKNGGNRRFGSGVDFKYLDDVLYDLEGLPGFIDDLSDYGYEAYSYMVTAIRNQDDSTIAEDANVFMEELIADGMDYALTDDEYDFLYNEVATYRSQANRYMGRNGGNQSPSRRVPVGGSRRVVSSGRQLVQSSSRKVVSRQRAAVAEEIPVRETVASSRRRPVVRAQEPAQSRVIDRRVPVANGNRYAGRDNCDDCRNYEPAVRESTRYAGRNSARR